MHSLNKIGHMVLYACSDENLWRVEAFEREGKGEKF